MDVEAALVPRAPPPARLVQLDGLRGVAAVAVLLYHMRNVYGFAIGFERNYLFVDLFFILSGFVLTSASEGRMRAQPTAFIRARFNRLAPMMVAGACLGAAVHLVIGDMPDTALLLAFALGFVPAIGWARETYPLNGPQWSLAWELAANVLHGYVLSRLSGRWLAVVALLFAVGVSASILFVGTDTSGPDSAGWWFAVARVGWSYTAGICMARASRAARWRSPAPAWLPTAALLALVTLLPMVRIAKPLGDIALVVLIMPLTMMALVSAPLPVRGKSILTSLGDLSYPLYAIHYPVLVLIHHYAVGPAGAAAATVVAISAAATLGRSRSGRPAHRRLALPSWPYSGNAVLREG